MVDLVETRKNELKRKKICRFCLSQDGDDLTNIYSRENRMKTAPLPLQVMACVSIEVFSNDCMPSFVCNECRLMFDYCYRFKQMCKKADTSLRHFPLTGTWSSALAKPKIPPALIKDQKPTNLNLMQVQKIKSDPTIVGKTVTNHDEDNGTVFTVLTDQEQAQEEPEQQQPVRELEPEQEQEQEVEPEPETEPEPEPESQPQPKPKANQKSVSMAKPSQRVLNKAAIRILNKEAQYTIEPRMSKPVLKLDPDGHLAIVTQILDPNDMRPAPDPKEDAAVVETNVFPCPHCERSFPLRQLLEIHMVNHNRERSFNCSDCDKSFFSKYDLQKHILVHTGEKPFKCVVCGKGFTRSTLLHRHEKTHTDIPKFICVFCEKPFISQEEMEKHTERHRKNRPFLCKICGKTFAFKQGLERHEVVHCRFQPYQCQYCEQSFSTPSKLSKHLTAHAGARPYPCKLCPKSYLLSHHLTRHMRSHKNGTGSYKCNDCDKTFSSRDDLIYHSAVHATQTLVCPLCKDPFEDIETVTDHVKQHAEGEAFACEFCDLIFMTADRLAEHIDISHAEDMVVYNEDDRANAEAEKKNDGKDTGAGEGIDEVIEEFLFEEFSNDGQGDVGGNESASSIIIKEETNWQSETDENHQTVTSNSYNSQDEGANSIADESMDYMNIIEMNENVDEPPVKVSKTSETTQQVTKRAPQAPTLLNNKIPIKPAQPVTPVHSNSSLPKENKKPIQKTNPLSRIKVGTRADQVPARKSHQPTIQAALLGLPKSLSVKKVSTSAKPEQVESKFVQPKQPAVSSTSPKNPKKLATDVKKVTPKVVSSPSDTELEKDTKQLPPKITRSFKRSETAPNITPPTKASTSSEGTKKPPPKPALLTMKDVPTSGNTVGDKKIVEMMIGDKRVKVQRITMSKAQAAAMAREGRIQMKEGAMILKRDPNQPKGVKKTN